MPSVNAPRVDVGPLAEAVRRVSAKTPLGTALRSKEIADLPLALRERAQFSATVESVRILSQLQRSLEKELGQISDDGLVMGRGRFVARLLDVAKAELGDEPRKGGIQDIRSVGRAKLIYDIQTQHAYGKAAWAVDTDTENLNAAPAQEFKRVEPRRQPRTDWEERWVAAGGQNHGGRMIALKTDPVWARLSRFDTPWPPYDYGSGMGVVDIYRDEAEALGLVQPGERLEATQQTDFNESLEASVKDVTPELGRWLQASFGDQVRMYPGRVVWTPHALSDYVKLVAEDRTAEPKPFRLGVASRDLLNKSGRYAEKSGLDLSGKDIRFHAGYARHQYDRHGPDSQAKARSLPMTPYDYDQIGVIVRNPDRVTYEGAKGSLVLWGDLPDGLSLRVVLTKGDGNTAMIQSVNKLKLR